jgi:hypothetical protein
MTLGTTKNIGHRAFTLLKAVCFQKLFSDYLDDTINIMPTLHKFDKKLLMLWLISLFHLKTALISSVARDKTFPKSG